ncbi:TetR/AcrR family transcriptional regulator [Thermomonospora umbrina]|uniref:TetR/AcrR family transcriptional regulator n=1 Tax=Thermomonospora umbrina TaxID=111806 RepID=UPI000E27B1DA|nr:TetR/AcrR family transcriptional regulator [Thermomonospora umbrina]
MAYRRTPRVQARLDSQRELLLSAAAALLAEQGYAGCTMAAVAARAGIATGTVYRHFASKSDLTVELFRTVCQGELAAMAQAAEGPGDLLDRIVATTETFVTRALKAPRLSYALLAEPVDAAVEAERLVFRRAFRDVFAAQIAEAVESGVLPPQDPRLSAAALVGAGAEALTGPLSGETAGPDTVAELVGFVLRALGVRPHGRE